MEWPQVGDRSRAHRPGPARPHRPGSRPRGAQQHLPMGLARHKGEGTGHQQHIGRQRGGTTRESAGRSTRSAHRQRWPSREGSSKAGWRPGRLDHARFVVPLAAVVKAEQVDLVVARHALPRANTPDWCCAHRLAASSWRALAASGRVPPTIHRPSAGRWRPETLHRALAKGFAHRQLVGVFGPSGRNTRAARPARPPAAAASPATRGRWPGWPRPERWRPFGWQPLSWCLLFLGGVPRAGGVSAVFHLGDRGSVQVPSIWNSCVGARSAGCAGTSGPGSCPGRPPG
jgi:hypothetical protein